MKITDARFASSSTMVSGKPSARLGEFAFIGRSNVGKSSLINMLTGNSRLAMTSSTPGKTKLVNHFLINQSWYIVDLPGYGYAKLSKGERQKLQDIISDYLLNSEELLVLFLLIDCRHPLQKADSEFLDFLGENGIPFAIIFTKGDKLGPNARKKSIDGILDEISQSWESLPPHFESSAQSGLGKEEILSYMEQVLKETNQNIQQTR